jgi:NAD(P)-dependent dehydrogenase (short-subunit alcohol dehydrogenase family)
MNIVITGSGRGIGAYIYNKLKKTNNVLGISRTKAKNTDIICDVSNNISVKNIFFNIKKIDVLINNASITNNLSDQIKNFDATISSNLNSVFYCSHYALSKLKKSKVKRIINISSINAHVGFPNNPGYVASKGGVNALTKSLAVDYGKFGIKVNSISLGYIAEGMSGESFRNKSKRAKRSSNTILNYWGTSEDVLGAVKFLISKDSSYMTGADLVIDGGWLAKGLK